MPVPAKPPVWDDMQGLVLSSYPKLSRAQYLLLQIDDVARTQAWLRTMASQHVTRAFRAHRYNDANSNGDGRGSSNGWNVNIAFTAPGLAALSGRVPLHEWISPDELADVLPGFSYPFVEGMAHGTHRNRILGSVGPSAPECWSWGAETNARIDILVCIFAASETSLAGAIATVTPPVGAAHEVEPLPATYPPGREHFGFADGISQPILAGSTDAERFPDSRHLTAVGEIVCGYPNGAGVTTPVPPLGADIDFGENGSYLVLSQFRQDVFAFRQAALETANGDRRAAKDLEAKIVGRRHDGTPLVPYASREDNEFGFAEDPYGYGCPLGAHMRRANPRDSFLNCNTSEPPATTQNRHRILRRGRPYGEPLDEAATVDDGCDRGLFFLCLNADIEQQFEFIQQNWINNPSFVGLGDEIDPLVGRRAEARSCPFTVPMLPVPARLETLQPFVRTRGGQYFFLPGLAALRRLAGDRCIEVKAAPENIEPLVAQIVRQLRVEYSAPHVKRDAHPRIHGLVQGVLKVELPRTDDRAVFQTGIFARNGASYPAWIRFSTGFTTTHDLEFEARGMAIKVMGTGDAKAPHQDFLLVSGDAFFLPNIAHYAEFFAAAHDPHPVAVPRFFWRHRLGRGFRALVRSLIVHAPNPLAVTYFSQSVFRLGRDRYVKVRARPKMTPELVAALPPARRFRAKAWLANVILKTKHDKVAAAATCEKYFAPADLLRQSMIPFLASHDAMFDIDVQLWPEGEPPVDDPTLSWTEFDVPFRHVATLTIPRQVFWPVPGMPDAVKTATQDMAELGEDISYSPWHTLDEHEPVGQINAVRRAVYTAIAGFRHAQNRVKDPQPKLEDEYTRLAAIVRADK